MNCVNKCDFGTKCFAKVEHFVLRLISVVKVRSFQPLERYNNYYVTQDFSPNTAIVYEGVQMMKDGITIKTDTIDMEAIRKEVELKQPIVK